MNEQIDCNVESIQWLAQKIEMLDARILKLETIIVELANVEPPEEHFSMEELAEMALENRANEDRGEDR